MKTARQKHTGSWAQRMVEHFEDGRFSEASSLYERSAGARAPLNAALLRARLLLRSDPPSAVSFLCRLRAPANSEALIWRDMLLGEAFALVDDYDSADDRFSTALALAEKLRNRRMLAELAYRQGRRYAMARDIANARASLERMRHMAVVDLSLEAFQLEGFILSREGRHFDQARVLIEILRRIDPISPKQMEHRVWATHTLATLARELFLPDAIPEIERQLAGVAWPDDFAVNRFQTLKAVAWAKALRGDYFNAFRYLKESRKAAPSDAWRTIAFCDRAYLATAVGEARWARQELLEAEELADRVDWHSVKNEEPVALLLLAEQFAEVDVSRAAGYVAEFRGLGDLADPRLLYRRDERLEAIAEYCTGIVDAALDRTKLAKQRFSRALEIYRRLRYDWRAARCELKLFELSKDRDHLGNAEELLRNYSSSWLAEELRKAKGETAKASMLSPMQDRVFRYVCEGKSNAEIAALIGRSEHTVANHAKAVLKAFGVSSRSALMAEAMKRGLL